MPLDQIAHDLSFGGAGTLQDHIRQFHEVRTDYRERFA